MKKLMAILLVFVCFATKAQVFEKGVSLLNVGVGFGSPYYGSGSKMTIPPVHASFEYGVTEKIGVGALVGYTSSVWDNSAIWGTGYKLKYSYLIVGARGAYHFVNKEKLDAYGGLMLGYNVASSKWEYPSGGTDPIGSYKAGGLALGAFLGGRYMFTEKIGAFAEIGYSIAWVSVGVTAKF